MEAASGNLEVVMRRGNLYCAHARRMTFTIESEGGKVKLRIATGNIQVRMLFAAKDDLVKSRMLLRRLLCRAGVFRALRSWMIVSRAD